MIGEKQSKKEETEQWEQLDKTVGQLLKTPPNPKKSKPARKKRTKKPAT